MTFRIFEDLLAGWLLLAMRKVDSEVILTRIVRNLTLPRHRTIGPQHTGNAPFLWLQQAILVRVGSSPDVD